MNIDTTTLTAQYERAARDWSFIDITEAAYDLPPRLMFAVGSRETNLTNEVGDGGHGHGVWQLDDRSHTIPPGFDSDVAQQCHTAATMLRSLLDHFGNDVRRALAAYNAGAGTVEYNVMHGLDVDHGTAGGDYSADVYARMVFLAHDEHTHNPMDGELDMFLVTDTDADPEMTLLVDGAHVWLLQGGDVAPYVSLGVPQRRIPPEQYTALRNRAKLIASA